MSDALIVQTYAAAGDSCFAGADYTGALVLAETGPQIDFNLAKDATVEIASCGKTWLTMHTSEALTMDIVKTATEITVRFNLSTVADVDYTGCNGVAGHFSGGLAVSGDFTLKLFGVSGCDYQAACRSACAEALRCCGTSYAGSSGAISVSTGAFSLNATSALWFGDAGSTGAGALILESGKPTLFASDVVTDGDASASAAAVSLGAQALTGALAAETRSADPFDGYSEGDASVLQAIAAATRAMGADPSQAMALKSTLAATLVGVQLAAAYAADAVAAAAVQPTDLALNAGSDSGVKGDRLTNDRTVQIDGVAGARSAVTLYDGEKAVGSGYADANGVFHVTTSALADGVHSLTAMARDASGVGATSQAFEVAIDGAGPAAPVLTGLTAQGVSGTAEAGAKVLVYDNRVLVGAATAGDDGHWSFGRAITDKAVHSYTATVADEAGNVASTAGSALITDALVGQLTGTSGDDVLVAGADDVLTGGLGKDLFVFDFGPGKATIADFKAGTDDIRVDQALAGDFAGLKAHAQQSGYDVVIAFDASHTLVLKGVSLASLSAGDFMFG